MGMQQGAAASDLAPSPKAERGLQAMGVAWPADSRPSSSPLLQSKPCGQPQRRPAGKGAQPISSPSTPNSSTLMHSHPQQCEHADVVCGCKAAGNSAASLRAIPPTPPLSLHAPCLRGSHDGAAAGHAVSSAIPAVSSAEASAVHRWMHEVAYTHDKGATESSACVCFNQVLRALVAPGSCRTESEESGLTVAEAAAGAEATYAQRNARGGGQRQRETAALEPLLEPLGMR